MMTEKNIDDFLLAYKSETDRPTSRQLMDNILGIPQRIAQEDILSAASLWRWFDLMMPKAVGWALTGCFGIYMGLSSPEGGGNPTDEEYYPYDQAQIMILEDMAENLNEEEAN